MSNKEATLLLVPAILNFGSYFPKYAGIYAGSPVFDKQLFFSHPQSAKKYSKKLSLTQTLLPNIKNYKDYGLFSVSCAQ